MDNEQLSQNISTLKKIDIFSELSEEILVELASKLKEIRAKTNETIIYKGEHGKAMFIIKDGTVKVHDDDHVFAYLSDGSSFGEYALIASEMRSATVTAIENTTLLRMVQEDFYNLLIQDVEFSKGVLKVLIGRLRERDAIQKASADTKQKIIQQRNEIEIINLELTELNEEKDHLMNIVAHDLRNPLTSCISISNSIKAEIKADRPDLIEFIDSLIKSLWRMNELVTRILDLKSIEVNKVTPVLSEINLSGLLSDIYHQFLPVAEKKNINLEIKTVPGKVNLDEGYTLQIFENLLSNAIKFSPPGGNVEIHMEDRDNKISIKISDQGVGFTEEDKKKMFGKYQKLSAQPTGGGIGLSIVKKNIDIMKGEILCISKPGEGAIFKVSFKKSR